MSQNAPFGRLRAQYLQTLEHLEARANQVTDSEHEWWPFGFLRPDPEELMSSARVAVLSVLYGLPVGLLMVVLDGVAHGKKSPELLPFLCSVCFAFFALYRTTFAYFWNRRAKRLELLCVRRKAWEAGRCPPSD